MWRFSTTEPVAQLHKEVYAIPIKIVSGSPQIIGTERSEVVLGHYTITQGNFHLTPELDFLFVGERPVTSASFT